MTREFDGRTFDVLSPMIYGLIARSLEMMKHLNKVESQCRTKNFNFILTSANFSKKSHQSFSFVLIAVGLQRL